MGIQDVADVAGSLAGPHVRVCVPVTSEHSYSGLSPGACTLLASIRLDERAGRGSGHFPVFMHRNSDHEHQTAA